MSETLPELSLVMIARNEAALMESFLAHHAPLFDEIVIVDTGSTDGTLEIASKFTDKVHQTEWQNDYAAPRNLSMDLATGRWILWMDPDELIEESTMSEVRKLIRRADALPGYGMLQRTYTHNSDLYGYQAVASPNAATKGFPGYLDMRQIRLVRGDAGIRFQGIIHETLQHDLDDRKLPYEFMPHVIHHYKELRSDEEKEDKAKRYHEITQQKAAQQPENAHAQWELSAAAEADGKVEEAAQAAALAASLSPDARLYQRDYLMRLMGLGRYEEAERHCDVVIKTFPNDPIFLSLYGEILMNRGRDADALDIYQISLSLNPNQFYACVNVGAILIRHEQFQEAVPFLETASKVDPESDLAWMNLGVASFQSGDAGSARRHFKRALQCNPERWQTHVWLARVSDEAGNKSDGEKHLALARQFGAPA